MNVIWVVVCIVSLVIIATSGKGDGFEIVLNGGNKAIGFGIKLWAIYAVWLGILKCIEVSGLDKKITLVMRPFLRKIVGKYDEYTESQIAMNVSSSILGMGNASTPSGINAFSGMAKGKYITAGMATLLILNTSSLQLIPSTIISMRAFCGSANPSDIILPCLISAVGSCVIGVVLVKICGKIFKDKQ